VYELGKYYNFDISLFERMVMNRKGCVTLQVQHRMAPEIAKLIVPTIYEKLENHKSVLGLPNVRGLLKRLYFLSHSQKELQVYLTKASGFNVCQVNISIFSGQGKLKQDK
jgi:AAA domain